MGSEYVSVQDIMSLCGIVRRKTIQDSYITPALYRLTEQAKVWKLNNID